MEESDTSRGKGRWSGKLALLFIFLFALLWSLGSFFFWTPLALAAYFAMMYLISSGTITSFFESIPRPQSGTPHQQPLTPTPVEVQPSGLPFTILKWVRVLAIAFGALFVFFFLVGVFVGNDKQGTGTETIDVSGANDNGTTYWNEKGNASLALPNYDSAVYYYDKALAIDPEDTYGLYNKGLAYALQQDYRRGNGYARRCVSYHPDYNPAWWLLGYNYDLMNNVDSAVYCLEKAYMAGYSQPDFLQLMGEVYIKKDRRSSALEVYKKLIAMDTTKADVYRKLAELDPSNAEVYRKKANAMEQK